MSRLPRDPDCELDYSDYFAALAYATDAEMDAAADRAWGDRLGQMDALVEAGDRAMGWGK